MNHSSVRCTCKQISSPYIHIGTTLRKQGVGHTVEMAMGHKSSDMPHSVRRVNRFRCERHRERVSARAFRQISTSQRTRMRIKRALGLLVRRLSWCRFSACRDSMCSLHLLGDLKSPVVRQRRLWRERELLAGRDSWCQKEGQIKIKMLRLDGDMILRVSGKRLRALIVWQSRKDKICKLFNIFSINEF
jgi:hypothetical protein